MMFRLFFFSFVASLAACATPQALRDAQETFPRVHAARLAHGTAVRMLFERHGLHYPPAEIFLRAFKRDRQLELWARDYGAAKFVLVKTFPICKMSGQLGPKREEADEQVPEGFYLLNGFNPTSHFHLSLRVSYPNGADQVLGTKGRLGGDIFVHGGCDTIGCLPLTDVGIAQLYLVAVDVTSSGGPPIPIHIFPMRLSDPVFSTLERIAAVQPGLMAFWKNLKQGYDYFERAQVPPTVVTTATGAYSFY